MHKNINVAELAINENGNISMIKKIFYPEHFPIGVESNAKSINNWFAGRSIPVSRKGSNFIFQQLSEIGVDTPVELAKKSFGLSLSDHYWINPENLELSWDKINFFQNQFSTEIGVAFFEGSVIDATNIDLMAPDNTSDGVLRKRWIIADDNTRVLIKSGSGHKQEPYNEVIASGLCKRLDVPYVPYTLTKNGDSACPNMLDENTELVCAHYINNILPRDKNTSKYQHFLDCATNLNIPNVKTYIDKMLTIDYIIANEDRHLGNFGAIRNLNTLEWVGMSPIFDCGSSLWYEDDTPHINVASKPFKGKHQEQIKLVTDLSWFDKTKLDGFSEFVTEILNKNTFCSHNPDRIEKICNEIDRRINCIAERQVELGDTQHLNSTQP
jgi:hypothetical protein